MSGRRNEQQKKFSGGSGSSRRPSVMACRHHDRNVNLVAPCCGAIVCCEQGHDEGRFCNKRLHLPSVKWVVCCSCKATQGVSRKCTACGKLFGSRACLICRQWYSGEGFHCHSCGRCIRASPRLTRHCKVCNRCYPIGDGAYGHICGGRTCVRCGEALASSRRPSTTMACGHSMHTACFLHHAKKSYSCPVRSCRQVIGDMSRWDKALGDVAAARPTAAAAVCQIRCRQCGRSSTVLDSEGPKRCQTPGCGSHNTYRISPSRR